MVNMNRMAKKVVLVECDYCGDMFDENDKDTECAELDECVCPHCVDSAHEQYRLSGEEYEGHGED